MKYEISILLLFILCSCGIPSFEYIDEPSVSDSDTGTTGFKFTINLDDEGYIKGFKLYARYYTNLGDDTSFNDLEISDTDNNTELYLKELGYSIVHVIDIDNIQYEDGEIDYDKLNLKENFIIDSDIEYIVANTSDDDFPIKMTSSNDDTTYTFISNFNSKLHTIGIYTDTNGEDLKNTLGSNIESKVYVEFAIFNTGSGSDLTPLESLPVYCTSIEIKL